MLKEILLLALVSVAFAEIDVHLNEGFGGDCLFAHNLYRKLHGVPALTLSPKLSQLAMSRAAELAELEELNVKQNKMHGQALGETVGSVGGFTNYNGISATQLWYSVVSKFDEEGELSSDGASFTQMVWKSTKLAGFGIAKSKSGKFFFVAEYFPSGNIRHQYESNVFQLTDDELVKPLDCSEVAAIVGHKKGHSTMVPVTTSVPVHIQKPVIEVADVEVVKSKVPTHSKVVDEAAVDVETPVKTKVPDHSKVVDETLIDVETPVRKVTPKTVVVDKKKPVVSVTKHTTTTKVVPIDVEEEEEEVVVETPRKKTTVSPVTVAEPVEVVTKKPKNDQVITLATPLDYEEDAVEIKTTTRVAKKVPKVETTTLSDDTISDDTIVDEEAVLTTTVVPTTKRTTEAVVDDSVEVVDEPMTVKTTTEVSQTEDALVDSEETLVPVVTKPTKIIVETTSKVAKSVSVDEDLTETVAEPVVVKKTGKSKRNKIVNKKSSSHE